MAQFYGLGSYSDLGRVGPLDVVSSGDCMELPLSRYNHGILNAEGLEVHCWNDHGGDGGLFNTSMGAL